VPDWEGASWAGKAYLTSFMIAVFGQQYLRSELLLFVEGQISWRVWLSSRCLVGLRLCFRELLRCEAKIVGASDIRTYDQNGALVASHHLQGVLS
jgi:hypothetical protein